MLAARGQICLMVDADGATKFSDLDDLEAKLMKGEENGYGIAVGSRAHLVSTDAVVQVSSILIYCTMDGQSGHAINLFGYV
jgi:dolichyl-phosphate beta-glucosyltransferase